MEHQQIEKNNYRVTPNEYDAGTTTSGEITLDFKNGSAQKLTLTENITTFIISNKEPGGAYVLRLVQDGTGGWTNVWNSDIIWGAPGAPTLSTTPGYIDLINLYCDPAGYLYGSYVLGYSLPA